MSANGSTDADEGWRHQPSGRRLDAYGHLLRGARDVDTIIPALARAAEANFDAGRALEGISLKLTQIGTDTARAVSDTVELKRHLKAITDREQVLRAELDAIKARLQRLSRRDVSRRDGVSTPGVVLTPERPPRKGTPKKLTKKLKRSKQRKR